MASESISFAGQEKKIITFEGEPSLTLAPSNRQLTRKINDGNRVFSPGRNRLEVFFTDDLADRELNIRPETNITVDGREYGSVSLIEFRGRDMIIYYDERASVQEDRSAELNARIAELEKENAGLKETLTLHSNRQTADDLEKSLAELNDENRTLADRIIKLTEKRGKEEQNHNDLNKEIANLEGQIKGWTTLIEKAAPKKAALEENNKTLTEEYAKYDPEIMAALQDKINRLRKEIDEAAAEFSRLKGEETVYQSGLDKQQQDNNGVQANIDAQPEKLKNLQNEYERLQKKLEQTISAEQECSEEKQQELRDEISLHEPVAEKLKKEYAVIKAEADRLNDNINDLNSKKEQEILGFWPVLRDAVKTVKENVGAVNSELDKLEEDVKTFNASVEACANKLDRMKSWYRVDSTPLQKLIDRVGQVEDFESDYVRSTLNVEDIGRINQLMTDTDLNLRELDRILGDLIAANIRDDRKTQYRAEANEQRAQAEVAKVK